MGKNKRVPAIRFKGFTEEWVEKELKKMAQFNPKAELPEVFEYVDLESVVGTVMISHREEKKGTAPSRAQRLAKQGDLFYQTVRPYQKNNYLFEKESNNYVFSTGYAQMRPYGHGYFLLTFLQSESFTKEVLNSCTGTSYPAISSIDLSELKAFSPELAEQKQIGEFFQNVDSLINANQRKLNKLKNIKKACLEKMFPRKGSTIPEIRFKGFTGEWVEKDIKNIGSVVTGNTPSKSEHIYWGGDFIWVTAQDMKNKYIDDSNLKLTNAGKLKTRGIPANSILVTCIASIGLNAINNHECATNQQINAITCNSEYYYEYIYYAIESRIELLRNLAGQTAVPIINKSTFENFTIVSPTIKSEQKQIGSFFKNLDNLIAKNEQQFEKLKNIKKACLEKMFVNKEDAI